MATATLEIDQTVLQLLKAKATAQGVSPDALLRTLLDDGNGVGNKGEMYTELATPQPTTPQLTPYQIARAKGLLGAVDSSVLDSNSPPINTEFGQHLLEEYEKQLEELTNGKVQRQSDGFC